MSKIVIPNGSSPYRSCICPTFVLSILGVLSFSSCLSPHTSIAAAAGVTVDWLATGQGIKNAAELRKLMGKKDYENFEETNNNGLEKFPRLQRYEHRLEAILKLMEDIENEQERDALISEIFARVSSAKQLDELKHLVAKLSINQEKTG